MELARPVQVVLVPELRRLILGPPWRPCSSHLTLDGARVRVPPEPEQRQHLLLRDHPRDYRFRELAGE